MQDKLLPIPEVLQRIGNPSTTTLWRMWSKGDFPKPLTISARRKAWKESDIDNWIAARAAKRAA